MSTIKLKRLELENFMGVQRFSLSLNGEQSISILGRNASGKTSLLNGYLYLLFDKNAENKKDFEIKPLTESGEAQHGLDSSVTGVFDTDGEELTLKKTYRERYTKRRGTLQEELTGHTVDYWINGVPVKQREYQDKIKEIADEKLFRLLSDIRFFNESLSWQERRQILLGACGDISDSYVIASDANLARLPGVIGKQTIKEYREIAAGRKAKLNKQLAEIPARIDEANKSKANVGTATKVTLQDEINTLSAQKKAKEDELRRIQEGGEIAEKTKRLREIEGQLQKAQNEVLATKDEAERRQRLKVQALKDSLSAKECELETAKGRQAALERKRKAIIEQIEILRSEWYAEDSRKFEETAICPTCNQAFPEEYKQKVRALFNEAKAKTLAGINDQGKSFQENLTEIEANLGAYAEIINRASEEIEILKGQIEAEGQKPLAFQYDFGNSKTPGQLTKEKETIEIEINKLQAGSHEITADILGQINELTGQIQEKQTLLAEIDSNYRADARIRELMKQEKDLAGEYEELEGNIFLTEEFIRRKVSMLDEKINSKFQTVRFRLFDTQINGGLTECCEATVGGVPYGSLNEASRINAGIEIASALSKHYGLYLPTWVDGAESCTDILKSAGQQIKLVVSKDHASLTVLCD